MKLNETQKRAIYNDVMNEIAPVVKNIVNEEMTNSSMSATTEWRTDFKAISRTVWDMKNQYLIEIEYVDYEEPEDERKPHRLFVIGTVSDGHFNYQEQSIDWMSDQKVLRYAVINS